MVEVNAAKPLVDSLVIVVLMLDADGYTKEVINIEYEWKPPRCDM